MLRARSAIAGLALAFLVVAAACSDSGSSPTASGSTPPPSQNGGRVVLAVDRVPDSLDPAEQVWTSAGWQVGRALYDRLAVYDESYQLQPELAESFTPNSDFTQWTIVLRAGVQFSDGSPLDAAALKANLDAQRFGPVAGLLLRPVTDVAVTGPLTVVVTTRTPWSTFPHVLASQAGFVASAATLSDPEGGRHPVGTGPFTLTGWDDVGLDLVAATAYWRDGQPRLAELVVRPVPDPAERSDLLHSGEVTLALFDEPQQLSDLVAEAAQAGDGGLQVLVDRDGEAPKVTVVLNAARLPFVDPIGRQAVGYATDRAALVGDDYGGLVPWVRGPVSDTSLWYNDPPVLPPSNGDARTQLERWTEVYRNPLTFSLLVPPEPLYLRTAARWQRQLGTAGIGVTIEVAPADEVAQRVAVGDFDAALMPTFSSWHPDLSYAQLHQSEWTPVGVAGPNLARYGSTAIDEALDDARTTTDLARQVDDYRTVQNELVGGGAYLFLLRVPQAVVAAPDVRDLTTWTTATGRPGLSMEHGTISLAQVWLGGSTASSG